MLASKGIAQGLSKLIVTQNGWRKRSSIICKALSTRTADKLRKDSEEYLDDMRKFLGKQKEGGYWDKEVSHMEEDDLSRRFMKAICKDKVNYEDIVTIAKTLRDIQDLPYERWYA